MTDHMLMAHAFLFMEPNYQMEGNWKYTKRETCRKGGKQVEKHILMNHQDRSNDRGFISLVKMSFTDPQWWPYGKPEFLHGDMVDQLWTYNSSLITQTLRLSK